MDTLLSIMGGLVLLYCLVYFNGQSESNPGSQMFDMDEGPAVSDGEIDIVLGLPKAEGAARPADH
jgi:hypothetical protein